MTVYDCRLQKRLIGWSVQECVPPSHYGGWRWEPVTFRFTQRGATRAVRRRQKREQRRTEREARVIDFPAPRPS